MSYIFVDREDELNSLCMKLKDYEGYVYADLETTGLDWMLDKILLCQLNFNDEIYLVEVRKLGYELFRRLVECLDSGNKTLVFHNAKFDLKFILFATKILLTRVFDTMLVESILMAGKKEMFFSLDDLSGKYTDYIMDKSARKLFINFPDNEPFTELMLQYSALDVKVLPDIVHSQLKLIEESRQMRVVDLENSLCPVVAKMEADGIRLDTEKWLEVEAKAANRHKELSENMLQQIVDFAVRLPYDNGLVLADTLKIPVKGKARRAGLEEIKDLELLRGWLLENFNVGSTYQMQAVLNHMGIPVGNTNAKTLADYEEHPFIKLLLDIREVEKQISTYGKNVIELIHPVTGKIHTEYSTVGTRTGRFSSKNPNMQNVPRSGGYRECFIPDEGFWFAAVDYSQQEYRLAGAVSRDPVIIEAYRNGSDMHTATAKILYGKDDISKDERNRGKTVNFAILYGSTEYGMKNNLNISIGEAKDIIDNFWKGYECLDEFMREAGKIILERGYSSTPLGRRRYNVPRPTFMNSYEFKRWQAQILKEGRNHIIQGGGADIIKLAMVEIFRTNPFGDKLRMCLQIHDEIVTQVHDSIKNEALEFIKAVMETVEQRFLGAIPAKVDGALKETWSK